jgi:hypothetical protein
MHQQLAMLWILAQEGLAIDGLASIVLAEKLQENLVEIFRLSVILRAASHNTPKIKIAYLPYYTPSPISS